MPAVRCQKTDSTVAATGRCLEAHTPLDPCPFFLASVSTPGDEDPERTPEPPAPGSEPARRFHSGMELGLSDVLDITRARYAHVVGIVGASNAGKTCFLNALYLLACHGQLLPEFRFAGSHTLQGFEYRARRLRNWQDGALPDQLADRTMLSDPKKPAFVHLALDRVGQGRIELLLTDLPGEWSTQLISRAAAAERFEFLARADAVVVAVDGPRMTARETRHLEVTNAKHLIERLTGNVNLRRDIPLVVLVTKGDEIDMKLPPDVSKIEGLATALGFRPSVIPVAAISRRPEQVSNGQGVLDLSEMYSASGRAN